MSKPTGLFERNGHFYLRLIIPTHQRHLFNGRTRIVQSLKTCSKRQAIVAATLLRAEILSTLLSQGQRENAPTPSGANITNQQNVASGMSSNAGVTVGLAQKTPCWRVNAP